MVGKSVDEILEAELRKTADELIEIMREDDNRSFGLGDFFFYVRFKVGDDFDEIATEIFAYKHFDNHYDLQRWAIGGPRWSFIPG